jgi:hypothetical protein
MMSVDSNKACLFRSIFSIPTDITGLQLALWSITSSVVVVAVVIVSRGISMIACILSRFVGMKKVIKTKPRFGIHLQFGHEVSIEWLIPPRLVFS